MSQQPLLTNMTNPSTSNYIDIDRLTAPDFSAPAYANSLVLATNNPNDTSGIDLTTPLSRTLFDLQEIDSNIHTLTSRSALEILQYTASQNAAAQKILDRVEQERKVLNESYARLEKEVLGKYEAAMKAKIGAERSLAVSGLLKGVQKILAEGRRLETLMTESGVGTSGSREDHKALVQATYAILDFRDTMQRRDTSELSKINVVRQVRGRIFEDGEAKVLDHARKVVREFSVSSLASTAGPTFKDSEEAKSRFISAAHILYLLSPAPRIDGQKMVRDDFEAEYLLRSLQSYLQTAITSSSAGIGRALGQLPTLDRALMEVSARCQNIIALEMLLGEIHPPRNPMLRSKDSGPKVQADGDSDVEDDLDALEIEDAKEDDESKENLLDPLLSSLDTSSLASYFWRSVASSLSSRVQELLGRGGVAARTLKSNKEVVRTEIRNCVLRGSKMPSMLIGKNKGAKEEVVGNWEREAAVMVGSIVTPLGR